MEPSQHAINTATYEIKVGELDIGVPKFHRQKGRLLIFLRPNENQLQTIKELDKHVWNPSLANFNSDLNAYVYWGENTRWGCELEHVPPGESRFKDDDESAKWLGGYWDPLCESSYDYAGRTIKSWKYTRNGLNLEVPNLRKPILHRNAKGVVFVVPG